jgi:hypothetical protein
MPTLSDTNRASFVQQEYRYATAKDDSVLGRNPSARTIEINTNLDQTRAQALADAYLAENQRPRVFEFLIEGLMFLDTLADGVPRFIADAPSLATDGRPRKLVSFTNDFETNTTTLQVRGS